MSLTLRLFKRHHDRQGDMVPVCPKCDIGLFILHFKGVDVDFCERCRGLWLDAGELEELLARTGAAADDPLLKFQTQSGSVPASRKHLCPRCDEPLPEINVRSLTLDRCPRGHGLWFDADELQQLLAMFPPAAGTHKTIEYLSQLIGTPQTT